jgi:hypothetical protein
VDAQSRHFAVRVKRQLGMRNMVAAMRVGQERLRALASPLDWPLDLFCGPGADCFFVVDEYLRAESPADVGRDHAQFVFGRNALKCRENEARDMRILAGGVQRGDVGSRIIVGQRRARLHRIGNDPVVDEIEFCDVSGIRKSSICRDLVANMPIIDSIVRRQTMHLRLTRFGRARRIDNRRQNAVVDDDLLGGVLRFSIGVGDHDGHRIADIQRLAMRERGIRPHLHGRTILRMNGPTADMGADLVGDGVRAGKNGDHARPGLRSGNVNFVDCGMRMRRAQKIGVSLTVPVDIVGVTPLTRDETDVFAAFDRGANAGRAHEFSPWVPPISPHRVDRSIK